MLHECSENGSSRAVRSRHAVKSWQIQGSCSMYSRAQNPIKILKQNLMLVLLRRDHLVFDHQFGDEILALSVACLLVKESSICIFIL